MNGRFRIPGMRSGALHTWLLILGVVGLLAAYDLHDQPGQVSRPRVEHRIDCEPLVWHDGMDVRGWNLLREQGYASRVGDTVDALYPPGCEATP